MNIPAAVTSFALLFSGVLMVVLAAVATVLTVPADAAPSVTESAFSVASTPLSGATATGSGGITG